MKKSTTNSAPLSSVKRTPDSTVVTRFPIDRKIRKKPTRPANDSSVERIMRTIDMKQLEAEIHESPTINASRIVDIHNRIIAGEYKIDAKKLAEKVIELESILNAD